MHSDPSEGVVDPTFRVHGLDGLMVADSSAFPDTVMHSTDLACYQRGGVAAELVSKT